MLRVLPLFFALFSTVWGIEVRWGEESIPKILPGELDSYCVVLTNPSEKAIKAALRLQSPPQWRVLSVESEKVELAPWDTKVVIIMVQAPFGSAPSQYPLQVYVEGEEISSYNELWIEVEQCSMLNFQKEASTEFSLAAQSYKRHIYWKNRGNVEIPLRIKATTTPLCSCSVLEKEGEAVISITPHQSPHSYRQIVDIKIFHSETEELLWEGSDSTEIIPLLPKAQLPQIYLPIWSALFVATERGRTIFGTEWWGGGLIDEERWVDFELRVPSKNYSGVYNKIEIARLGIGQSDWSIEIGDAIYRLTPLTELLRFGRGIQGYRRYGNWEVGGLYVHANASRPESGAYLLWQPSQKGYLRYSFFYRDAFKAVPKVCIQSYQAAYLVDSNHFLEGEYAVNSCCDSENSAYHIKLQTPLFFNLGSLNLERIWAGAKFYGYYTDTDMTAIDIQTDLTPSVSANLYATLYSQFIGPQKDALSVSPDNRFYQAQLYYRHSANIQYATSLRSLFLKDRSTPSTIEQKQQWADLRVCYTKAKLSCTGSISLGAMQDLLTAQESGPLQSYSISGYWQQLQKLDWNFHLDMGNIQYYDIRQWRSSIGVGCRYSISSATYANVYANIAANMPELCYFTQIVASLGHTFSNGHRLYANTKYFSCRKAADPKEFQAYLSYEMPLNFPIAKRVETGTISGQLYRARCGSSIEGAIISLGEQRTVTDANGCYRFAAVQPGEYQVFTTFLPEGLIGLYQVACVYRAEETKVNIAAVEAGRVEGEIVKWDLLETMEAAETLYLQQERGKLDPYLQKSGYLPNISLTLTHKETKSVLHRSTNSRGHFTFERLRPGEWTLSIEDTGIPSTHYIEKSVMTFVVEPGQKKSLSLQVMPQMLKGIE